MLIVGERINSSSRIALLSGRAYRRGFIEFHRGKLAQKLAHNLTAITETPLPL